MLFFLQTTLSKSIAVTLYKVTFSSWPSQERIYLTVERRGVARDVEESATRGECPLLPWLDAALHSTEGDLLRREEHWPHMTGQMGQPQSVLYLLGVRIEVFP